MSTAEVLNAHPLDKVLEPRMAELIGTTQKAMQRRREKKLIPEGVWQKLDGRIYYSISRYNEWQESQWTCRQASNQSAVSCASDSHGTKSGGAKRSRIPKHQKGSQQQQVYLIK